MQIYFAQSPSRVHDEEKTEAAMQTNPSVPDRVTDSRAGYCLAVAASCKAPTSNIQFGTYQPWHGLWVWKTVAALVHDAVDLQDNKEQLLREI